jgi:hypothetical protein
MSKQAKDQQKKILRANIVSILTASTKLQKRLGINLDKLNKLEGESE